MKMEKLDNKLNSNNPMLVAEVFSKLIENITVNKNEKQGFTYLKSKCLSNDPLVSEVAAVAIVKLVENGTLHVEQVLADFITNISTSRNLNILIKIIGKLLYHQLLQKQDSSKEDVIRIQLLQHPFIKILQGGDCHIDIQMCMANEVIQSYKDKRLSPSINDFYYPVYLYCICSPTVKSELSYLRHKLWTFLIKNDESNSTEFILKICCWIQMQSKTKCELSGMLIDEVLQAYWRSKKYWPNVDTHEEQFLSHIGDLLVLQTLVVYNMVLNNVDCNSYVEIMMQDFLKFTFTFCDSDLVFFILSKTILVCSPLYLENLLKLCLCIFRIDANEIFICEPFTYFSLKSSLLPWLASPSMLTQNAMEKANEILTVIKDPMLYDEDNEDDSLKTTELPEESRTKRYYFLKYCNPEIFLARQLHAKMERTRRPEKLLIFFEDFEYAPTHFLKHSFTSLCGLILCDATTTEHKLKILALLLRCSSQYTELCPPLLTLILYLLSNTHDNRLLFELLKALPHMAKVKENVPKVIATIQAISKRSNNLGDFAIRLMYDTFEVDNKCYSNLESILNKTEEEDFLETNITKAYIFKKLSETRPELYGRDLVAYFSKILNECVGSLGSLPTALALEGIRNLCKAEIIDIVTTWATLAPKFKEDNRVPVIKSLCLLIGEIPHLQYTQAYEKLNDEVVKHLWNYVTTSHDEEVINAALDSLASFNMELICSHLPDVFLDENYAKQNPLGGQRLVPGKTWLTFLTTCKSTDAATNFIIKLVSNEIKNYLKYVYQVKAQREPENYGGLPTHSIVRALGEFVKSNATKVKNWRNTEEEAHYIVCLKILSLKYSKPLPPLDWWFLQELIHDPKMKNYCLDLASHQVVLSGSARRLIESYIAAITQNSKNEEFLYIYRNLKYLANSIQPMVIKPFIENSLHYAFNRFETEPTFVELLNYLKEVLTDEEVQHINKNVIEAVVRQLVFITDVSSKAFPLLLNCISYFSQKGLEEITKFNATKFDQAEFEKIIKIRCYLAENGISKTPLNWLNDIFEIASKNNVRINSYFEDLAATLKHNINHEDSPLWLMEQFGQIQAKVAERCDQTEIEYFCDILAIVLVYFSGFFVLTVKNDYQGIKYFFPAAITFLLDEPLWSFHTSQVLEWLHHMNTAESIPKEYQHIFGWSLCSLRHQEEFSKSSKWMKYLDCEIYTDNKK